LRIAEHFVSLCFAAVCVVVMCFCLLYGGMVISLLSGFFFFF
jgi:hypothetical protein